MKKNICFLGGMLLVLLTLSGFTEDEAAYDGWIFRTVPSLHSLLAEEPINEWADCVEPIWGDIYRTTSKELLDELEDSGLLVYAEPDYWVELEDIPDDPRLLDGSQYSASAIEQGYAWSAGITGKNVRIGILDSGLYSEHEDLTNAHIAEGWNYCSDSPDTSDEVGHGTFVAGIIVAQVNNGLGAAGIAPEAEVVPMKCFESNRGKVSSIAKAMVESVDVYHCNILNLSFGLKTDSQLLREAVSYAQANDVLMIAAAGNLASGVSSTGNDPLMYPAAYEAVIGVGAVDISKNAAPFSYQNLSVYVTAPGQGIIGLGHMAADDYVTKSGTSFAAPMVTAAAALARSVDLSLSGLEFQKLLLSTSEDLGMEGYDPVYGYGLLNIERLLLKLQNETEPGIAYGYVKDSEPDIPIYIVTAAYDEDGRMIGVAMEILETSEDGTACIAAQFDEKADAFQVRLIIMSETCSPLCDAATIK